MTVKTLGVPPPLNLAWLRPRPPRPRPLYDPGPAPAIVARLICEGPPEKWEEPMAYLALAKNANRGDMQRYASAPCVTTEFSPVICSPSFLCGASVTRGAVSSFGVVSSVLKRCIFCAQGPPGPPGPSGPPGLKVEPRCLCQTFVLSRLPRSHRRLALAGRSRDAGSAWSRW